MGNRRIYNSIDPLELRGRVCGALHRFTATGIDSAVLVVDSLTSYKN